MIDRGGAKKLHLGRHLPTCKGIFHQPRVTWRGIRTKYLYIKVLCHKTFSNLKDTKPPLDHDRTWVTYGEAERTWLNVGTINKSM
jgi:hypothetical protein